MPRRSPIARVSSERPQRGSPEQTRQRLVLAAAEAFNRDGYAGTDSNRIAREAGYAPGTFYKHFEDKRAIFLAVYADWVAREWKDVSATLAESATAAERARAIVEMFLEHHRRWSGFRASLRALVATDAEVRDFYRDQRRRQLEMLADIRRERGHRARSREEDALLLYTLERTADAIAEDEPRALGVALAPLRQLLVDLVERRLEPRSSSR
jgi:AcrR family transcriptional regulator